MNKDIIAYYTIARKEIIRILRIWPQALLPPIITTCLYLAIFGRILGSRLGDVTGHQSYLEFVIPGLIIMPIMIHAYENTVASFFISKFQRSIEELLVSSTPNYIIIFGYLTGGVVRGVLVGLLVYLFSTFFVYVPIRHIGLLIVVSSLSAVIFSLLGLVNAFFAKSFDDIAWVTSFILTPLTYLGGVFYSIIMLPQFWQKLTLYNPIFHIISTFRFAYIGYGQINLFVSLGLMIALATMLFYLATKLLNKGIGLRQ
jgi:ABC-2 type transport system permease protein